MTESRNSEGYATYPDGLLEKMNCETDMFADFVVCPYTKENPEDLQFVCIDSASRIALKEK